MKYISLIFFFLFIFGCNEKQQDVSEFFENESQSHEVKQTIDEKIIRHVEGTLSIPGTEKYALNKYYAHLNKDDSLDCIITVNRLEKALEDAVLSGKASKKAEIGFVGKYNYYFYMDGLTKDISTAIPIPSSPHRELDVEFQNILSGDKKDFTVDYRIRNSSFRAFYTITDNLPRQIFETKIFDRLGEQTPEAFVIEYLPGSFSNARDIFIYKGEIENITFSDPLEVYKVNPKITSTGDLERKWYFNDGAKKYFTEKDQ